MYASLRSVTAENGKILSPTRTGKFLVDLNGPGILRDGTLVRLKSCIVVMHSVLCYTECFVAVSSAIMFFSRQFNAYS